MAGAILERELTPVRIASVEFGIASPGDDAEIRRLLQENPMTGRISVSLEREPDYFADANLPGERKQTIIARAAGKLVCVGSCCVRKRFVNGLPRDVGYLGGLRMDAAFAGRFDILRCGYEFFRRTQANAPADFYFTSIASDNGRARKFLERGLPGMPAYEFLGEFVTILLASRGNKNRSENISQIAPAELMDFIHAQNQERQFAPCFAPNPFAALGGLGLRPSNFFMHRENGQIEGCAAIWDQRSFRQTVVRSYSSWITPFLPVINLCHRASGQPLLPKPGTILSNAMAFNLLTKTDRPDLLIDLIRSLAGEASRRGIHMLNLGFAANDRRLAHVRKHFRFREYRSRIYTVRWPGIGGAAKELDGRVLAPEVALL